MCEHASWPGCRAWSMGTLCRPVQACNIDCQVSHVQHWTAFDMLLVFCCSAL